MISEEGLSVLQQSNCSFEGFSTKKRIKLWVKHKAFIKMIIAFIISSTILNVPYATAHQVRLVTRAWFILMNINT